MSDPGIAKCSDPMENPQHQVPDLLPQSQDSSSFAAVSPPNHQCHRLCHLLGCFKTAPWVQQVQNVHVEQYCGTEPQLLFNDSQSGLAHVLCATRAAFEGVDQGLGGCLNFKRFLDALQALHVDMPYHHRLALFMNSDLDQDA